MTRGEEEALLEIEAVVGREVEPADGAAHGLSGDFGEAAGAEVVHGAAGPGGPLGRGGMVSIVA